MAPQSKARAKPQVTQVPFATEAASQGFSEATVGHRPSPARVCSWAAAGEQRAQPSRTPAAQVTVVATCPRQRIANEARHAAAHIPPSASSRPSTAWRAIVSG